MTPLVLPTLLIPSSTLYQPPSRPGNCSAAFGYQLTRARVPILPSKFRSTVIQRPTASLTVLLAIGFTSPQMASGLDSKLMGWLSDLQNMKQMLVASGVQMDGNMAASWIRSPEVVLGSGLESPEAAQKTNIALAVGLAVPLGVCLIVLGVVVAVFVVRRRRQGPAGGKAGGSDDGSGAKVCA